MLYGPTDWFGHYLSLQELAIPVSIQSPLLPFLMLHLEYKPAMDNSANY